MSIWDCEKPLDAMMLSHDQMAMLVTKHEQQIKDIAAHLLELRKWGTPMMEFKREDDDLNNVRYKANYRYETKWVGLTGDEKAYSNMNYAGKCAEAWHSGVEWAEAILKEKNGG